METIKLEIHKYQKCCICKEPFFNEKQELVNKVSIKSDLIPAACDKCLMPFIKEDKLHILILIRCYSIGDTIAATPIIREIKRIYPDAKLAVWTFYPELFELNPHLHEIFDMNRILYEDMVAKYIFRVDAFDSDKCHHFAKHSVEFSAMSALNRSLLVKDWGYEINYDHENQSRVEQICFENNIDLNKDKVIILNPHGTEWSTRDWGPKHFPELLSKLKDKYPDYKFVSVGGKRSEVPTQTMNNYTKLEGVIDLYGKFTLLDSICFFNQPCSKLLITPDTGTLHLGGCSNIPIVGIFTLVKGEFRTPVRNEIFGYKFTAVNADDPCSCTYNSRYLTDQAEFKNCPHLTVLNKIKNLEAPNEFKIDGLKNLNKGKWESKNLNYQIDQEIKKYSPLKCFPTVEKVFKASVKMIDDCQ